MLVVPIAALLFARSLIPDWDSVGALVVAPVAAAPKGPTGEDSGPRLRGRVLNTDGNQVVSAIVRLVSTGEPPEVLAETKSRRDGSFSFASPGVDARAVAEHDPDGVAAESVPRDTPGAELMLVLSAAEAIHGTVVDTDDRPIAGATITAVGVPWAIPPVTTLADGTFRIVTVPHEATSLTADARGYETGSASLQARVQSTEPTEHVFRLRLVPAPAITGEVLDPDGNPAVARVIACEGEAHGAEAVSGSDGTFELPASTAGCTAMALRDDSAASDEVTIAPGARLTLRLNAGGAIEGVVVDERGSAISPFQVGIESFSAAHGHSMSRRGSRGFDDPGGVFRLENLAPGTYVLTATARDKPPTRSEPIAVSSGAPTRGVRIVLATGGVVVGHVYDDQHDPLANVDLSFDQVSSVAVSRARARTDDSGAYRLEGAPAGPFTLRAYLRGYRLRMTAGLRVDPGATLTEDVTLTGTDGGAGLELGGIGATLEQTGHGIILRSVFPGDPADLAGLESSDVLVRIDGQTTEEMSLADVLQCLRGTPGTSVGVSVSRAGASGREPVDAVVVRALVVH
jgi:hypothetical protein